MADTGTFVLDEEELRRRAREHVAAGPITPNYEGDVARTVEVLNDALATELVCVLRDAFHAITAPSRSSEVLEHPVTQRDATAPSSPPARSHRKPYASSTNGTEPRAAPRALRPTAR